MHKENMQTPYWATQTRIRTKTFSLWGKNVNHNVNHINIVQPMITVNQKQQKNLETLQITKKKREKNQHST